MTSLPLLLLHVDLDFGARSCEDRRRLRLVTRPLGQREEVVQVVGLEKALLRRVLENAVDQELLEDLSMVNLLLDCPGGQEAVNGDITILADPPGSFSGLSIGARVPIRIEDHHPVSPGQVNPEAADSCGEQKHKQIWRRVKLVDQSLPRPDWCAAVQLQVQVIPILEELFQNDEHLSALGEEQHFVALLLPQLQQSLDDDHLARPFPVAKLLRGLHLSDALDVVATDVFRPAIVEVGMVAYFAEDNESDKYLEAAVEDPLDVSRVDVAPVHGVLFVGETAEQNLFVFGREIDVGFDVRF